MNELTKETQQFIKTTKEVIDYGIGQMMGLDAIREMSPDDLKLMQSLTNCIDSAMRVMELQNQTLDEMNNKLANIERTLGTR